MMHGAWRFPVQRPVAITMIVLAALVFGGVGLIRLPVNLLPDISYPTLTIRTRYPGATPVDVEERVSERIQENVSVVPGVRRVYSVSRPEASDVVLEFNWGTEMVLAVSDVRERLDRVSLPGDAEEPLVLRYDPALDPVMTVGITGNMPPADLRKITEDLVEERLQLDGVAAVKVRGGDDVEVRIAIDEQRLSGLGLDVQTVSSRLAAENINSAAGRIEDGKTEYLVRAFNEYRDLDEIRATVIENREGDLIRLDQVATVERVAAEPDVISRINNRTGVLVDIQKEAGANVVAVCKDLRERLFGTEKQRRFLASGASNTPPPPPDYSGLGRWEQRAARRAYQNEVAKWRAKTDFVAAELGEQGLEVELLQDQSKFIEDSVWDVVSSAILGGMFAIAVIYLFLRRLAATAILAVSIPISLVATFAPMFLTGIDLNIMSLGGLALGVGMLVDNSIVVLESIYKQKEEGGGSLADAAAIGTHKVAGAVTASTLTTVAVFAPIVFVEGVAGQLFRDQAMTVVFALLLSLGVALLVIPMLASRGAGGDSSEEDRFAPTLAWVVADHPRVGGKLGLLTFPLREAIWLLGVVLRFVGWLLTLVVRFVLAVVGGLALAGAFLERHVFRRIAILLNRGYEALAEAYIPFLKVSLQRRPAVLGVAVGLLILAGWRAQSLGAEILPKVQQGEFYVDMFLPRDATVERTDGVARKLDDQIRALNGVATTFVASGVDPQELNDSDQGPHSASILVRLAADIPEGREDLIQRRVRELAAAEPAIRQYRIRLPSVLAFQAGYTTEVIGQDLLTLRQACQTIVEKLREVPGLTDVRSTLQRGNPELAIRFDRDRLAVLNLETQAVTNVLRSKVLGEVATRFTELERKIDMRVQIPPADLGSQARLGEVNVNPAGSPAVPLDSVAEIIASEGPSEIRRLGTVRGAEVRANISGLDLGSTQALAEIALAELELPSGVEIRSGSQKEEMESSQQSLIGALLLAVFLVYVVMASQFENLVQPLVILVSLPLALVGSILALDLLDVPISVIVFLGAIVLAGIVVNNAIILIDRINKLRGEGMPKAEAVVNGAGSRLRPVLMTTLTTVLGLLPLTGWLPELPLLGGSGVELRAPLAITVIAGLTVSTLLTLVVIPVLYTFTDRRA